MVNEKDIPKMDLVGKNIEVVGSSNKKNVGIKGKIIDETKNMIKLEGEKSLIKNQILFRMKFGGKTYEIDGRLFVGRPEDRIKKQRRIK